MRILVTGGAGFIGSHVVDRLLAEGEEVIAIDDLSSGRLANLEAARRSAPERFSFERLDITSSALKDFVAERVPDMVFHLAAQVDVRVSLKDPVADALVNVIGTANLLQSAAEASVGKVVFASSGGCIYGQPDEARLPITEDQLYTPDALPESPYGVSKKAVLDYLRYFRQIKGLDYTVLALANIYGPRQEPATEVGLEGQVVAIFSRNMLAGRPCTIYGDGSQTRDFVFVDDVASAFLAARERGSGVLVNISSGHELSVTDLHAKLQELTGDDSEPMYAPARAGELQRISLDHSKASRELGWGPATDLDEGLKQTVESFRSSG